MMNSSWIGIAFSLCAFCAIGQAQTPNPNHVFIPNGFWKGNDFRNQPESLRQAYVMGLFDGLHLAPMFDASPQRIARIGDCAEKMTSGQILAIADIYLTQHPEQWDFGMNQVFLEAIQQACAARGIKLFPGQ
jgi:hypothetical protein